MLWLALRLSSLALEICRHQGDTASPLAIVEQTGNHDRIHARNKAAALAGVAAGQTLGAALALCSTLRLFPREQAAEQEALRGVATWALNFSDQVSLHPPQGVFIEIGGSLRLFGGLDPLYQRIRDELTELGHCARTGVAPTPLGAWWLARAGQDQPVRHPEELRNRLGPLPLTRLELPDEMLERLHGLGLRTLDDCLRLPRADLARRLGPLLHELTDRALGLRADPRKRFTPPPRFGRTLWLPAEVEHTDALLFGVRRLLLELTGFLRALGTGLNGLQLRLLHSRARSQTLEVRLLTPSRAPDRLLALLRERLAKVQLTAPVQGISLEAKDLAPLPHQAQALFETREKQGHEAWQSLVESLRARLGSERVHGLRPVADYRPEQATSPCEPGESHPLQPLPAPRPLWLLPEPQPVPPGTRILSGPERIASGWWEEERPDEEYFVVETPAGERLWARQRDGKLQLIGRF